MPPATAPAAHHPNGSEEAAYPSRNIAFQAAAMITSIVEHLSNHDELRYCPAFMYESMSGEINLLHQLLTLVIQCLQLVLGSHHARLSNALLDPLRRIYRSTTDQRVHERSERSLQGLARGQDGAHPVRVHFGQ